MASRAVVEKRKDARRYGPTAETRKALRQQTLQEAKLAWEKSEEWFKRNVQRLQQRQQTLENEQRDWEQIETKPKAPTPSGFQILSAVGWKRKLKAKPAADAQKPPSDYFKRNVRNELEKIKRDLADLEVQRPTYRQFLQEGAQALTVDLKSTPEVKDPRRAKMEKGIQARLYNDLQYVENHHTGTPEILDEARAALLRGVNRGRVVQLLRRGIIDHGHMVLHERIREQLPVHLKSVIRPEDIQAEIERVEKNQRVEARESNTDAELQKIGYERTPPLHTIVNHLVNAHQQRGVQGQALRRRIQDELESAYYENLQYHGKNTETEFREHRQMARQFATALVQLEDELGLGLRKNQPLKNVLINRQYQIRSAIEANHLQARETLKAYDRAIESFQKPQESRRSEPKEDAGEEEEKQTQTATPSSKRLKHPPLPWDVRHDESKLEGLRSYNVSVLAHITQIAWIVAKNAHIERIPEREETISIHGRQVNRRFIHIEDLKREPPERQRQIFTPEFRAVLESTGKKGLKLEYLPGAHLFVDVSGHLFKSSQTHPEIRDPEFLENMLKALERKPDYVTALHDGNGKGNGNGIIGYSVHHTILYNDQPEKMVMHLAIVDRNGNKMKIRAAEGKWLDERNRAVTPHFRLVTAFLKERQKEPPVRMPSSPTRR